MTQGGSAQTLNLGQITKQLEFLYAETTRRTCFWNPLHSEFSRGANFEHELIRMTAESFGGKGDRVMGMVTSGGTESLMAAALAYRNWGREEKGLAEGEAVILAPDTIHAALFKAALAYDIQLVLVPTDETGAVDMKKIGQTAAQYKGQLVAIFGSAPSFPTGKIDPIVKMAQLAKAHQCGFHADCCLGASLINFLPEFNAQFFQFPDVTSLSADPHKYGFGPKGVSTLLGTCMPGGKPLMFYLTSAFPDWQGGLYGTVGAPGSRSSTAAIQAVLAAKTIGKSGYRAIATAVRDTTIALGNAIKNCEGLRLLGDPDLSVVAFKVDKSWNPHTGTTYEFVHQMHKRGFTLNSIKGDAAHFCVTPRFVAEEGVVDRFMGAAKESLEVIQTMTVFSEEAGIYCDLDAAINPTMKKLNLLKFIENSLLGRKGAEDTIRWFLLARNNPRYGET